MGFLVNWPDQPPSPVKTPLIDLYVETAAGDKKPCAPPGNYFPRTSTSVMIRETAGPGARNTGQTDTDKTSLEPHCRTHGSVTLNGEFLITHDGLEPSGGLEGFGENS